MSKVDPDLVVQTLDISDDDLKILTPASLLICGPSQAGKSEYIYKLIHFRKDLFDCEFHRIIYCEPPSGNTSMFFARLQKEFPTIEHCYGLPDFKHLGLLHNSRSLLLICDDLMMEICKSESIIDLIVTRVHHCNITFVYTMQNYFCHSKFNKTLTKNTHYRVIFYNRIAQNELSIMSSQMCNSPKFFASNFKFLTDNFPNEPAYLFVDGMIKSPVPELYCRSLVFPNEQGRIEPIIFLQNPNFIKK
jgi:hypothetical protein